jgi:hypothetical protein
MLRLLSQGTKGVLMEVKEAVGELLLFFIIIILVLFQIHLVMFSFLLLPLKRGLCCWFHQNPSFNQKKHPGTTRNHGSLDVEISTLNLVLLVLLPPRFDFLVGCLEVDE